MLLVNDVYKYGERKYRVLWKEPDYVYWIDIDDKSALPEKKYYQELLDLLADEVISYSDDPYAEFVLNPPDNNKWVKDKQDKAWEMLKSIVFVEPDIYINSARGPLVSKLLIDYATTKQTVYAKLRQYWQRGKVPNALYIDSRKFGGRGLVKKAGNVKRGRPRTVKIGVGVNIDEQIAKIFRVVISKHYLSTDKKSINHCYNQALIALQIDRTKVTEEELAETPTYEQFFHFLKKDNNPVEMAKKRYGDISFAKDIRPVLGTSGSEVIGPGSRYQIDATIGDVYLLSESDRATIIGRPVIYIVIDVFSRLVTGLYVGLEGPSWVSAMSALSNTMSDKVSFCKRYGIGIEFEQWPVNGKPEAILGDRGEILSITADMLSEALNIRIENTPPYRADWKGIVERYFNTVQAKFKPYVQGYVTGVISKKRAGPDYRLDAELTLNDITKIIIRCVLQYNSTHHIENYDADSDMPPNLPHNPLQLWNWGVNNRTGKLRSVNEDLMNINLLPHSKASVTPEGIKLFGCLYSAAFAIKEGWFHRINTGPSSVKVAYDPHNANKIYLRPEKGYDQYVICDLTERSREYRNMTFWDVWRIRPIKAKTASFSGLTKTKGELGLDAEIEKIVNEAKENKSDVSHLSKASRVKGIDQNRSNEKTTLRRTKAEIVTTTKPNFPIKNNVVSLTEQKLEDFSVPFMLDELNKGEDEC